MANFLNTDKVTHGCARRRSRTREYQAWASMRSRCFYRRNNRYHSHGGRGIKVCDRWLGLAGFANFLADMGPKPTPQHQLDRINNDGNYEPGNCRWATPIEQARNRRTNRHITFNGKTLCITQWATLTGLNRRTIIARLDKGWSAEQALTTPV